VAVADGKPESTAVLLCGMHCLFTLHFSIFLENQVITITDNSITVSTKSKRPIVMFGAWDKEIKILNTPDELAEWERRVEAILGTKVSSRDILAKGGCCCGGGGGMCDND
jgi:hypothetical protein